MAKFKLLEIPHGGLKCKMRDLFNSLIDHEVSGDCEGYLKSLPTNYGFVFFWYGWIDEEALEKYYTSYFSKEKLRAIDKSREENKFFSLRNSVYERLFSIVKDHPDVMGGGYAETHIGTFLPKLKQATAKEAAQALKQYAQKLEKIQEFLDNYYKTEKSLLSDIESGFEVLIFSHLMKH